MTIQSHCCRFCGSPLQHSFVDLGMSPLCESYIDQNQLNQMEPFYPLSVNICDKCFLVQLEVYVNPVDIFSEYAYFSSFSDSWLAHSRNYSLKMIDRFQLNTQSYVVEVASNDGYLLQYFIEKNIPVLGIEPASNVAKAAISKGIPTLIEFFGQDCASRLEAEGKLADLIIANNVLAQVPELNDFVAGIKKLLKSFGVITIEFPHLLRLIEENQFDTIYHEHFSYFSFTTVINILKAHNLKVFDVEKLSTHGGSLRIYASHDLDHTKLVSNEVLLLLQQEDQAGITNLNYYSTFSSRVQETKRKLLECLIKIKKEGKTIAGYGAPGKGNTLLNYCGIRTDFLEYTVDRNPFKQGKFLPGTHIPIYHPDKILQTKPDFLFILPWNFKDEIIKQEAFIREWGGQFIIPIPEASII